MSSSEVSNQADLDLAVRIAAGDEAAWHECYELYGQRLYRLLLSAVGYIREDAEDLLQETLIAVVRGVKQYRGESSLFSWMCGIALHKAATHRRWYRRFWRRLDHALAKQDWIQPRASGLDIEHLELTGRVWGVLRSLPSHYSDALLLKYVEGFDVREIAQIMGRSFLSAQSLLARARKRFRENFGELEL